MADPSPVRSVEYGFYFTDRRHCQVSVGRLGLGRQDVSWSIELL